MQVEPGIFKAYDLRGLYPEQINEEVAYVLGKAFATLLTKENPGKALKIAVGSDMRLSSPALKKNVIQGILDSGVDVDDIGLISTPTFYFASGHFGYDGGIQVSASHNPKEWNGAKIVRKGGRALSQEDGILELREIIATESYAARHGKGNLTEKENVLNILLGEQLKYTDLSKIKPLKIVIDGSNSMGSVDMAALFAKLPCQVIKMNFELDGSFPVHEADPMKEDNNAGLKKRVIEEGADLGIAPDGDGDRYFFVDEKGEMVPQHILRGIMAQIELKEHPGATVAYDIRPGKITKDMIDELGGKSLVTRVGHSLIKEMMIKNNVIFGGESSGHYFYKTESGTFEAPIILVTKLLEYISVQNKPFSEVLAPFKRYVHSGEINLKLQSREEIERKIEDVKKKYADGKQVYIDGVSVEYPTVWFNLRASNTEPLIRLTIEGKTSEDVDRIKEEILGMLKS